MNATRPPEGTKAPLGGKRSTRSDKRGGGVNVAPKVLVLGATGSIGRLVVIFSTLCIGAQHENPCRCRARFAVLARRAA